MTVRRTTASSSSPAIAQAASLARRSDLATRVANQGGTANAVQIDRPVPSSIVIGPEATGSVDGDVAVFDGTTGLLVRASGVSMASLSAAVATLQNVVSGSDQVGFYRPSKYERDAVELAGYTHRFATDAAMVVGERGRTEFEVR